VRAGAQVIVEALATQSQRPTTSPGMDVNTLLPGLGVTATMDLDPHSRYVGRTLKQIDLRGLTGASVIAIERAGAMVHPTGDEALLEGDTLVLIGSRDAVAAAQELLRTTTTATTAA